MTTPHPYMVQRFTLVPVDVLRANPRNARVHPPEQLSKLKKSIRAFGMMVPIVVDADYQILAGHGRFAACKDLGMEAVPTIKVDHLSEEQMRAFMLADNKIAEGSAWDIKILKEELQFLHDVQFETKIDFDWHAIGFETVEADNLLFTVSGTEDVTISPESTEALIDPSLPPRAQLGDIWVLGQHRIICGDSTKAQTYKLLMAGAKAQCSPSDPPYNIRINGFVSGKGKNKHREFIEGAGEKTPEQFTTFLFDYLENTSGSMVDGGLIYVCMDFRHMRELSEAADRAGLVLMSVCVWDKGTGAMGSLYRSQYELVFVFKKGKASHVNNVMLGKYGRNRTNVWKYPSANMSKEGRQALKGHPTPKPIPMFMDLIKDVTNMGDIVLDPFLGSGTTLLAAEKTGRRAYCIEIDPLYVDLAIRRWEALTGKQARKLTANELPAGAGNAKQPRRRERIHGR